MKILLNDIFRPIVGVLLISLSVFVISCSNKELFSEFHSFQKSEWEKQEVVRFEVPV